MNFTQGVQLLSQLGENITETVVCQLLKVDIFKKPQDQLLFCKLWNNKYSIIKQEPRKHLESEGNYHQTKKNKPWFAQESKYLPEKIGKVSELHQ